MHRDHRCSGIGKCRDVAFGFDDHEVHVERYGGNPLERTHDRDADRQIRDESPIHDVDVDEVSPTSLDGGNLVGEMMGEYSFFIVPTWR